MTVTSGSISAGVAAERACRASRPAGSRRLEAALVAVYAGFALMTPVLLVSGVLADGAVSPGLRLVTYGLPLVAGLACAGHLARHPALDAAGRRPWRWLTLSLVLLGVSGFCFAFAAGGTSMPLALLAVGTRAGFTLALLATLLAFAGGALRPRSRLTLVLDTATVVAGGGMALWYLLVGAAVRDHAAGTTAAGHLRLVYPLLDLVLIAGVVTLLLRGVHSVARRSVALLLAGAVAHLAGDVHVTWRWLHPGTDDGVFAVPLLVSLLCLPMYLLAAAAVEYLRRLTAAPDAPAVPERLQPVDALPYLALALGHGLLVIAAFRAAAYPWAGLIAGSVVMTTAVSARQYVALRENKTLVLTDSLTGLANRVLLRDRLARAGRRNAANGRRTAVLVADLDGFKHVNDTFGHDAGDRLLIEFAQVLRESIRATDTASRLGGDEFAVVLDGVEDEEAAVAIAERILTAAGRRTRIADRPMPIRASIGIAVGAPGAPSADLLRHADLAMYAAKRRRTGGWQLYRPGTAEMADQHAVLREELTDAVSGGHLALQYQPIVTLASGDLVGVEALVRWPHPERGVLPPAVFIPLAEETGVIDQLGNWVLETACRQVLEWHREMPEGRELHLSVNCSPLHVDRGTLAADVLEILDRTGFDPQHLVLEITEGTVVDEEVAIPQLRLLRERGVRIAIDDFGTGYSSLRYLARLPIDILKLDRFFVAELNGDPEGSAVAEAVIRLGQALHLDTIAEGIEDLEQASELAMLGFRNGQGYHFARPLDPDAVARLIRSEAGTPLAPVHPGR